MFSAEESDGRNPVHAVFRGVWHYHAHESSLRGNGEVAHQESASKTYFSNCKTGISNWAALLTLTC
jgi:hypothetical protein